VKIAQLGDGQSIELPGQARNCEFQPDHDRATGLKPGRIDGTGDETNRCRSTEEVQEPAPCELRRRQVRSLSFPDHFLRRDWFGAPLPGRHMAAGEY